MSTLTSFIQHSFGSPRHSNQRRNTNKRNPNWKEVKLLTDDIIIYTENPKDTTRKALEPISEFSKVSGQKLILQKSIACLYTNNKRSERESKESFPFTTATTTEK